MSRGRGVLLDLLVVSGIADVIVGVVFSAAVEEGAGGHLLFREGVVGLVRGLVHGRGVRHCRRCCRLQHWGRGGSCVVS